MISNPVVYYGSFRDVLSSSGFLFLQPVTGSDLDVMTPRVMNFHTSIQQNVGFGTVVDVAYVGSLGRNLLWRRLLDPIPLGANFNPANANPTNPRVPLSPVFLRRYQGYSGVTYAEWAPSSNYHSLQVTANRRFARNLEFGVAWTWSKAMDFNDADGEQISSLVPIRVWNYGLASFDRTHVLKVNWLWNVPRAPWRHPVVDRIVNHWQVSGIASFGWIQRCHRHRYHRHARPWGAHRGDRPASWGRQSCPRTRFRARPAGPKAGGGQEWPPHQLA